jgi:hypothetical protein
VRHVTGKGKVVGQHFRQGVACISKVWHIIRHTAIPRLKSQDHGQHRAEPRKAADRLVLALKLDQGHTAYPALVWMHGVRKLHPSKQMTITKQGPNQQNCAPNLSSCPPQKVGWLVLRLCSDTVFDLLTVHFNNAVSSSGHLVRNWRGHGRNQSWGHYKYYPSIWLKGLKKTTEYLSW